MSDTLAALQLDALLRRAKLAIADADAACRRPSPSADQTQLLLSRLCFLEQSAAQHLATPQARSTLAAATATSTERTVGGSRRHASGARSATPLKQQAELAADDVLGEYSFPLALNGGEETAVESLTTTAAAAISPHAVDDASAALASLAELAQRARVLATALASRMIKESCVPTPTVPLVGHSRRGGLLTSQAAEWSALAAREGEAIAAAAGAAVTATTTARRADNAWPFPPPQLPQTARSGSSSAVGGAPREAILLRPYDARTPQSPALAAVAEGAAGASTAAADPSLGGGAHGIAGSHNNEIDAAADVTGHSLVYGMEALAAWGRRAEELLAACDDGCVSSADSDGGQLPAESTPPPLHSSLLVRATRGESPAEALEEEDVDGDDDAEGAAAAVDAADAEAPAEGLSSADEGADAGSFNGGVQPSSVVEVAVALPRGKLSAAGLPRARAAGLMLRARGMNPRRRTHQMVPSLFAPPGTRSRSNSGGGPHSARYGLSTLTEGAETDDGADSGDSSVRDLPSARAARGGDAASGRMTSRYSTGSHHSLLSAPAQAMEATDDAAADRSAVDILASIRLPRQVRLWRRVSGGSIAPPLVEATADGDDSAEPEEHMGLDSSAAQLPHGDDIGAAAEDATSWPVDGSALGGENSSAGVQNAPGSDDRQTWGATTGASSTTTIPPRNNTFVSTATRTALFSRDATLRSVNLEDENTQDDVAGDMAALAAQLKASSLNLHDQLQRDNKVRHLALDFVRICFYFPKFAMSLIPPYSCWMRRRRRSTVT